MPRRALFVLTLLSLCLLLAPPSPGMINPKFTPINLVTQSDEILQLRVKPNPPAGKIDFDIVSVLKGKDDNKTIEIDLTGTAEPDHAEHAADMAAKSPDKLALLFIGSGWEKPGEAAGDEPAAPNDPAAAPVEKTRKAYLQIDGAWFIMNDEKGVWKFDRESVELVGTWNGGSDMLLNLVKYILDDPANATVAVKTGTHWGTVLKADKIAGNVTAAVPVDLKRNGVPLLFVASDAGDRLYECTDDALTDVTAKYKLQSKSLAFAWSDFSAEGRLGLASWDGKTLTLYQLGADNTFTASPGAKELSECIALTPLDIGSPAKPGLLITTSSWPMLLIPGPDAVAKKIGEGDAPVKDLGKPGPCLVADFDGDSLPDIIQPFAKGSLFYKGTSPGSFKPPVACPVALGEDPASACIGDWNSDGLFDVYCVANDRSRLWENLGEGRFADRIKLTGEMRYTGTKRSTGTPCAGDINNDGWQDLLILHDEGYPQVYFNRAFRSFGLSISMDLGRTTMLPEAEAGQQAGCLADFTGNGAQDMAMILKDGQVAILLRMPTDSDLSARVIVSPKSKQTGPVRVWANDGKRKLGACNITAGSAPAFLSRPDAGPLTIRWQFPGQAEQFKEVVLEKNAVTVMIEPVGVK